jgi:hypothetical protein
LALYRANGLVVTVVRRATGYPQISSGRNAKRLFVAPTAEAQLWHWYDQVYHQLPVTVAVQVQHTTQWLPSPDRRRLELSDIQFQQYVDSTTPPEYRARLSAEDGACTVIGRNGTILYGVNTSEGANDVGPLLQWLFTGQQGQAQ